MVSTSDILQLQIMSSTQVRVKREALRTLGIGVAQVEVASILGLASTIVSPSVAVSLLITSLYKLLRTAAVQNKFSAREPNVSSLV